MNATASNRLTRDQYDVLRLIKGGLSLPEIAEELGSTYDSVRSRARTLSRRGLVQRNGRGHNLTATVDLRTVRPR